MWSLTGASSYPKWKSVQCSEFLQAGRQTPTWDRASPTPVPRHLPWTPTPTPGPLHPPLDPDTRPWTPASAPGPQHPPLDPDIHP